MTNFYGHKNGPEVVSYPTSNTMCSGSGYGTVVLPTFPTVATQTLPLQPVQASQVSSIGLFIDEIQVLIRQEVRKALAELRAEENKVEE